MHRVWLPARLARQHLGRQRVADLQSRHEVERLSDKSEHPPIIRVIGDGEFPL